MVNVRNFGAAGDGHTDDTAAVQAALDTGEKVIFPPGVYMADTIYLRSGGGIHLEEGAILKARADRTKCNPDDFPPQNAVFASEHVSGAHFIIAHECEDLTLSGEGTIDGNFRAVFDTDRLAPKTGHPHYEFPEWRMAQMIFFCRCRRIKVRDLRFENAHYWNCFFHDCEDVSVSNLTIRGDRLVMNTDGLDVDCCRRVLIENCDIDTGDDCVAVRANERPLGYSSPCEDVEVRNCRFSTVTCAIRLGVGAGVIRNCRFHDLEMRNSCIGIGICPSFRQGTCCQIEDACFEDITFTGKQPFILIPCWCGGQTREDDPAIRPLKNLTFRRIRASGRMPSLCIGPHDSSLFSDIRFEELCLKLAAPVIPPREVRWPRKVFGVFNIANFPGLDTSGIKTESEIGCPGICRG